MEMEYFKEVKSAIDDLEKKAKSMDFEEMYFFSEVIDKKEFKESYIYVIYFENQKNEEEMKNIKEAIECAKNKYSRESNDYIAFPKVNSPKESKVLYVGKSSKDLKTRLDEHLCKDFHKTTYGLHLSAWWKDENFGKLKIKICNVSEITKGFKINALTLLEDAVSYEYKPLLGRRGDSPKAS